MAILHQSTMLPQIAAPMFDHVYCLQPSAADNPWLNKLSATPRGSEQECPHLFINDILVRPRGYRLPNGEGKRSNHDVQEAILQCTNTGNTPSQLLSLMYCLSDPINRIKYRAAREKQPCQVLNCCSVQQRLTTLLWHLRELGGVKKNDNRFVSVKELSHDTGNSSASLFKAQKENLCLSEDTWVNHFAGVKTWLQPVVKFIKMLNWTLNAKPPS